MLSNQIDVHKLINIRLRKYLEKIILICIKIRTTCKKIIQEERCVISHDLFYKFIMQVGEIKLQINLKEKKNLRIIRNEISFIKDFLYVFKYELNWFSYVLIDEYI